MRTLGIDLAAEPKRTAVAVIQWETDAARLLQLKLGVADEEIVGLVGTCDVAGIDCPPGWPAPFLPFLQAHHRGEPAAVLEYDGIAGRRLLAYRETDRFVVRHLAMWPLSVAADRLGHTAMRCAVIQAKIAAR